MDTCNPSCCERAPGLTLLPEAEAVRLAGLAKAFGDPIRVQILHLLELHPDLCNCEFEDLLGMTQSKISYHLKVLLDANLITRRLSGTWSHYSLVKSDVLDHIRALNTMQRP